MSVFERLADNWVANLGAALLFVFLFRIIARHRPRPLEQLVGIAAWIAGCIVTVVAMIDDTDLSLLPGIMTTMLFFALVIYIEEPFWSMKKLRVFLNKKHRL